MEKGTRRNGHARRSRGVERTWLDGPGRGRHHHGGPARPGRPSARSPWATPSTTRLRSSALACCSASTRLSPRPTAASDHDECHRWLAQGVYLACIVTPPLMLIVAALSFGFTRFGVTPAVAVPASSLPAHSQLEHASAAALRRHAPLPAGRRPGPRHHRHLRPRQPAQLGRQLGSHLRQARLSRAGRQRLGASPPASRASAWPRRCSASPGATSASAAIRCFAHWAAPQLDRLKQLVPPGRARRRADRAGSRRMESRDLFCGLPESRRPGHALHRAQLRQHHLHGPARCLGRGRRQRRPRHRSRRPRPRPPRRMARTWPRHRLHALRCVGVPGRAATRSSRSTPAIPRVLAVGPGLLGLAAAFQVFDGIQTVSTGALRGLGETRIPMFANFVGYWLLGLPLGFTLCFVLALGDLRDVDRPHPGPCRHLRHRCCAAGAATPPALP